MVREDGETGVIQHVPEMSDSGVAGKEFSVKGRVLLLGSLELFGEESQGLPVLLAGKLMLEARAHVHCQSVHK